MSKPQKKVPQSLTHTYRLIEGLLLCIKPEKVYLKYIKLTCSNYTSLPLLLPSITHFLPSILSQSRSYQLLFCKFIYYYIYNMNMENKLSYLHVQKFLETLYNIIFL